MQPTKQKTKKVWFINNLQQIRLICAVFIHILSTKLAKCAIYKANLFAFAEYPHTNAHVHYIKTNNKLYLQSFACVRVRGMLHPIFNHHYKTDYICKITTTTKYVINLCRVRVRVRVCRLLLANTWMMIYVLSLPCVSCPVWCVIV